MISDRKELEGKMRKSIAAAVIAASALTAACGHDRSENGGPTVSRNYQVGNFQEIEAAGPFDVTVRTGASPSVSARGPQKLLERMVVEVKDGKLLIHPQEQHGLHFNLGSHDKTEFTVTVPQLNAATLAGAGDLNINGVKGDRFEATVAGSGDVTIGSVDVQALKVSTAGAGDAKVGSGQAATAEYAVVGAGDVDASGVNSHNLKVSITGAGTVKAHATGTADITSMGAGDVTVTGGARCNVHKTGPSDVNCS
jgi:hypothetical protein